MRAISHEIARALNGAHYASDARRHHIRWGRRPQARLFRYGYGIAVTEALVRRRYAIPVGKRARYAHLPRFAWIAWERGRVVGIQVRYRCGGHSTSASLETVSHYPVCPKCQMAELGSDAVVALLSQDGPND